MRAERYLKIISHKTHEKYSLKITYSCWSFFNFAAARDMDDNLSCLSIPGTRRTVYLSGNETVDGDDTSAGISVNVSNPNDNKVLLKLSLASY